MNRRRFISSVAKGIAGLVAANSIPAELVDLSVKRASIESHWRDITFKVYDLTGYATISRDMLADLVVPMQLMEQSMMVAWNDQIERKLFNV